VRETIRLRAEDEILDRAAALFARRGFEKTSVQAVADAVGLSKAGLLHHFARKQELREAVLARSRALQHEVLDQTASLPLGPARDRLALEILVDQALNRPGMVAFGLSVATSQASGSLADEHLDQTVLEAFGVAADQDPERLIRVLGALGALPHLALILHRAGRTTAWRALVIDTCFDALGHPRT
jgi:AcrR family transcriptional regulator